MCRVSHRQGLADVLTLIVLGIAAWLLLIATAVVERLTHEARPVPGCGCDGGCRGR